MIRLDCKRVTKWVSSSGVVKALNFSVATLILRDSFNIVFGGVSDDIVGVRTGKTDSIYR